jgi:hypothetical protein
MKDIEPEQRRLIHTIPAAGLLSCYAATWVLSLRIGLE